MSNPFDQFAADFQAALPPGAPSAQPPAPSAQPPAPSGPPMNAAPPMQDQGYGGPFGQPQQQPPFGGAPSYGQNPYEQNQPSSVPPPGSAADPFSSFGAPQPPQQQPQAPLPGQGYIAQSNSDDSGNPFGGPAPGMDSSQQGPPMPGLGSQMPPQAPQDGSQNPYGGFMPQPPGPEQQSQQPFQDGSHSAYGGFMPQPPAPEQSQQPPAPEGNPYADPWGASPAQQQPPAMNEQNYGGIQAPPFGAPPQQDPSAGALVPAQQQSNPYAMPPQQQQPPQDQNALVASQQQSNYQPNPYGQPTYNQDPAYGQPPTYGQQPPQQDPFGGYGQAPNPYGQPPQQYQQAPPPPAPVDPFSVFESQSKPPEPAPQENAMVPHTGGPNPTASDDDFWGSFGTSTAAPAAAAPEEEAAPAPAESKEPKAEEEKKGDEGLPPGGEWYDARIFTPTLGVMFFKPQELTDSLFLNTDRDVVDALGERPVVAFIVEGSSARAAGVELGHVLLKVNGLDVRSPKEASRLIKESPRPLPLLFYVPNTDVVIAEGEHMVKYDTRETTAPNSAKDWKPKYVVIGGIIAQPWMMNMYRSKSEYDIAVIETQARRPVSVKVKQFSLQGARIQNDWQGPQMVKYKNKLHPWKYIVVLPVARNPIKISSPNLTQLKPVHEGIRRVLLAQQRNRGGRGGEQRSSGYQQERAYNGTAAYDQRGPPPQQAAAYRY